MTDPSLFPDADDATHGSRPPTPLADRLPKGPENPERPSTEAPSPGMKRDLRRAFLILLGTGLIIGALTATGVVWVMHHFNLIGVPEQPAP
jgi:hypothetical protein